MCIKCIFTDIEYLYPQYHPFLFLFRFYPILQLYQIPINQLKVLKGSPFIFLKLFAIENSTRLCCFIVWKHFLIRSDVLPVNFLVFSSIYKSCSKMVSSQVCFEKLWWRKIHFRSVLVGAIWIKLKKIEQNNQRQIEVIN